MRRANYALPLDRLVWLWFLRGVALVALGGASMGFLLVQRLEGGLCACEMVSEARFCCASLCRSVALRLALLWRGGEVA